MNEQTLNLRDIHLPEAISWWPLAPGWWLLVAGFILMLAVIFISRKIYLKKQLKRDIKSELENIKLQFQQSKNKSQLAKSLSVLLRRASMSYYPKMNIAGLTGDKWLSYLDQTCLNRSSSSRSASKQFQSETGKVLLTAPYLPENARLEYDAQALIHLCESWLLAKHKETPRGQSL
jgi:hypothetical protein